MKLNHYNPEFPILDDAKAWRYMSLPKLINLIEDNEIYFARLDSFDDPLEGLCFSIRSTMEMKRLSQNSTATEPFKTLFEGMHISKKEIKKWQVGSFASCWHITENRKDESLAMWDLYTDKYSFAFTIKFETLKQLLSECLEFCLDIELEEANYGMVEYLSLYHYGISASKKIIAPGFVKEPIYSHEKEMRFMLHRKKLLLEKDRVGIKLKLKTKLADLKSDIEIISHPDMDDEVSNVFIKKIDSLGFNVSLSKILTKNNIKKFIVD